MSTNDSTSMRHTTAPSLRVHGKHHCTHHLWCDMTNWCVWWGAHNCGPQLHPHWEHTANTTAHTIYAVMWLIGTCDGMSRLWVWPVTHTWVTSHTQHHCTRLYWRDMTYWYRPRMREYHSKQHGLLVRGIFNMITVQKNPQTMLYLLYWYIS